MKLVFILTGDFRESLNLKLKLLPFTISSVNKHDWYDVAVISFGYLRRKLTPVVLHLQRHYCSSNNQYNIFFSLVRSSFSFFCLFSSFFCFGFGFIFWVFFCFYGMQHKGSLVHYANYPYHHCDLAGIQIIVLISDLGTSPKVISLLLVLPFMALMLLHGKNTWSWIICHGILLCIYLNLSSMLSPTFCLPSSWQCKSRICWRPHSCSSYWQVINSKDVIAGPKCHSRRCGPRIISITDLW